MSQRPLGGRVSGNRTAGRMPAVLFRLCGVEPLGAMVGDGFLGLPCCSQPMDYPEAFLRPNGAGPDSWGCGGQSRCAA